MMEQNTPFTCHLCKNKSGQKKILFEFDTMESIRDIAVSFTLPVGLCRWTQFLDGRRQDWSIDLLHDRQIYP